MVQARGVPEDAAQTAAKPASIRVPDSALVHVLLELIDANPRNPRHTMHAVEDLAESLRTYGLLQPVLVRPVRDRYEVVAGHRRVEAARRLAWTEIPALVRTEGQHDAYVLTVIENLQRTDLTSREEAQALEVLVRQHGYSTRQVAAVVHRSPAYISKRLRVFEDEALGPLVLSNQLTTSAAEELLVLSEPERRLVAEQAAREQWDQWRLRSAVRTRFAPKQPDLGLRGQIKALRQKLQRTSPWQLSEGDRKELRLLFAELGRMARAPAERQSVIFPPLPVPRGSGRSTTSGSPV